MITAKDIKKNQKVKQLLKAADFYLNKLGYTEHGSRHADLCARIAGNVLEQLGYAKEEVELARIAAYLHDVGNLINRQGHAQSGALIAFDVLHEIGMSTEDIVKIMAAISNHEETEAGQPISNVAAAVILADKSDVHRTRVKKKDPSEFDIHDKVNWATLSSFLEVKRKAKQIQLKLTIDTKFAPIMRYFEIFLDRMLLMERAAQALGCKFELLINKVKIL